jgi:inositol 3-alpha-galactosyltransferase
MAHEVPVDVFIGTGKFSTLNAGYSKRAYVIFLASNGDYVKGWLVWLRVNLIG